MPAKYLTTAIAYAPQDDGLVHQIEQALLEAGVPLLVRHAGAKLHSHGRAAAAQDRLLVAMTRASLTDGTVIATVQHVLDREWDEGAGARIIPLVFDASCKSWTPTEPKLVEILRELTGRVMCDVDVSEPRRFQRSITRLLRALEAPDEPLTFSG